MAGFLATVLIYNIKYEPLRERRAVGTYEL